LEGHTRSQGHGGDQPADAPSSWCISFMLKRIASHSWQDTPVVTQGPRERRSPSFRRDTIPRGPPPGPPVNSHRNNGNPSRSLSSGVFLTFASPVNQPGVLGNNCGVPGPPRTPGPDDTGPPDGVPDYNAPEPQEMGCLLVALLKWCPCLELKTLLRYCPCLG